VGFKERSLAVAGLIAQPMDLQALRDILHAWPDKRTTLDRESSTTRVVSEFVGRFKEHGAGGFVREELDRLRRFGESAVELDENASVITETGRVLSERLIENPQEAISVSSCLRRM
jgi:hypothetical protein